MPCNKIHIYVSFNNVEWTSMFTTHVRFVLQQLTKKIEVFLNVTACILVEALGSY
jgi:hypothetical protein